MRSMVLLSLLMLLRLEAFGGAKREDTIRGHIL